MYTLTSEMGRGETDNSDKHHFSWWTEMRDHHKHKLISGCLQTWIGNWFLWHCSVRGSTPEIQEWVCRDVSGSRITETTGLQKIQLFSTACRTGKVLSIQPDWVRSWRYSHVYILHQYNTRERFGYSTHQTYSLPIFSRGPITFHVNRPKSRVTTVPRHLILYPKRPQELTPRLKLQCHPW